MKRVNCIALICCVAGKREMPGQIKSLSGDSPWRMFSVSDVGKDSVV
jgi:hypothetical protein